MGDREVGGWHKGICPPRQLLGRAALQEPPLHRKAVSQACSCTWSSVPHAVPQGPHTEEDGDLILGAFCVTSEQRDSGLGSPATGSPGTLQQGGWWSRDPLHGSLWDPAVKRRWWPGVSPQGISWGPRSKVRPCCGDSHIGGMGTMQPGRQYDKNPPLVQLRTPQQGGW